MTIRKLCLIFFASAFLFAGCSGGAGTGADIDPDAAADAILEQVEFRDSLVKAEGGAAENYYRLDDTIADYAIYMSGSGASAEEIAVLKVKDSSDLEGARAILDKRLDDLIFLFEDYVPSEMVKLNDPVIVTKGDVAVMVLADDTAAAKKAVDGILA